MIIFNLAILVPRIQIIFVYLIYFAGLNRRFANDLRLYAIVQFVPCFAIPAMAILLPPKYSHSHYWLWAAGSYPPRISDESIDCLFLCIELTTFHMVVAWGHES